jgi:hypothetical protein
LRQGRLIDGITLQHADTILQCDSQCTVLRLSDNRDQKIKEKKQQNQSAWVLRVLKAKWQWSKMFLMMSLFGLCLSFVFLSSFSISGRTSFKAFSLSKEVHTIPREI